MKKLPAKKIREINKHIPAAVAEANAAFNPETHPDEWNRAYHAAMGRILIKKGLRKP